MRNRIRPGGPFLARPLFDAAAVYALSAAEYQFGTHQLAVHQSQCFSFIWKAAVAAVATNVAFPPLVTNARAPQEQVQPQSRIFSPLTGSAPRLIHRVSNANVPQLADLTIQGWIEGTAPPRQGAVSPLVRGSPQLFDFTLQAEFFAPTPMAQGRVSPLVKGSQDDPTQIAARVFPAARPASIVANPIAGFFVVPPQNEDRPTAVVWGPQRAGQTPPIFRLVQCAPQLLDLTQQGRIFSSVIGRSLPFKSISAGPQLADFTQQGIIFATAKPAALILGTTVWPLPSVKPQPDLNVNASCIWTQGPLTVAGAPTSDHRLNRRYRGYDKGASKWDRGRR